jgi:hypothetical protein
MTEKELTLKSLKEKYQYDNQIRKYSTRHYRNDNSVFAEVSTNQDVERHRNYLVRSLNYYKKVSPLEQDDIKDIEQAMGRYEIAVIKIIQTCDFPSTDFNYSAEELNNLINDVFTQQENVYNLLMRKLYQ